MKTILIPLKGSKPIDMSEKLDSIGILKLKRNEDGKPTDFGYLTGISEKPEFIDNMTHTWAIFKNNNWKYHRIKLTEKGEQILKDNQIDYEYE